MSMSQFKSSGIPKKPNSACDVRLLSKDSWKITPAVKKPILMGFDAQFSRQLWARRVAWHGLRTEGGLNPSPFALVVIEELLAAGGTGLWRNGLA